MTKKEEHADNIENIEESDDETLNDDVSKPDKIVQLEEEVKILKDTLLRKAAEFENFRKRIEKEKDEAVKYSNGKFAKDLLVVEDNFERVVENSLSIEKKIEADVNFKALWDGILLCKKELVSVFKKHGISKIEVKEGDQFDPQYHEAICEVDNTAHEEGIVIQVFQVGYAHNDRLLRPAMVSVSKKA